MKLTSRFLYAPLAALLAFTSCAEDQTESYPEIEAKALEAWITQHRQYLVGNGQQVDDGKTRYTYYVDVLDAGDPDAAPVSSEDCWVSYDFSGRNLVGDIVLTRMASDAVLEGTFTKYTHYVPFYRYCGSQNTGLMEGTWLAMRNKLTLSEAYFDKFKNDPQRRLTSREVLLRQGSKVVLYLPSSIVGNVSGSGGYGGQYELSAKRPFIATIAICDTVKNPLQREGTDVDAFCELNGGLQIYSKGDDEKPGVAKPTDPDDPEHPYNPGSKRWVSACDTIPQLYVNVRYNPAQTADQLTFPKPYHVGYEPYVGVSSITEIDRKIAEALVKRFHSDEENEYEGVKALTADSVTLDGTAKIWYIARFLDGFVFETNIDEVKEIVYGEIKSKGSAVDYTPSSSSSLPQAFYYAVPNLKYGQWAELAFTSTYGFGSSGRSGTSSSSSSASGYGSTDYLDYVNYLNYVNSYYGSGGYYGGYYGDYYGGYGGYGGGYYGGYYGSDYDSSDTGSTVTTVTTEIQSFTPLIYQFYIEPKE